MRVSPSSQRTAERQRDALEQEFAQELDRLWVRFVDEVQAQANKALTSPALVAAGPRERDPFAYTNVLNTWRGAVRELSSRRGDIMTEDITMLLMESNLPYDLYVDTRDLLVQAREEGWSDWKAKREISALLIPKKTPRDARADTAEHRDWVARVRGIARTAATRNYNILSLDWIVQEGMTQKRWCSQDDPRVRPSHAAADGQTVPVSQNFTVAGYLMSAPGDPAAPASETANCRCYVVGVE